MIFGSKGWIGIDIGTHCIKYAQVERHKGQLKLAAAAVVERDLPIDKSGWLRTPPVSSAREFKIALQSAKFSGKVAACVTPISVCDTRTLNAEGESLAEQQESIGQQLAVIHGVAAEKLNFDIWKTSEQPQNQFHVISLADRWTHQVIEDQRNAKLKCKVLDGVPLALARAAAMSPDVDGTQPLVVFDWGSSTATLCFVVNSQPIYVRSLADCGFANLENRVAQALGMDVVSARKVITRNGVPRQGNHSSDEVQQLLDEILSSQVIELEDELLKTIAYLKNKNSRLQFHQGLIFGAGARLKNVGPWLGARLRLQMHTWKMSELTSEQNDSSTPIELFGPAVALSSLPWEAAA